MGRWTGRLVGTLIALLFLTLVAGEGPPPLSNLPLRDALIFAGMTALFAGLIVAWKWELLGGLITLLGYGILLRVLADQRPVNSMLTVAAGMGLVHVLCWWRIRAGEPPGGVTWAIPKVLLVVPGVLGGVFLLLCANEVFSNPPLMTPALHPSDAMQGLWQAKLRTVTGKGLPNSIEVQLTVHADGSVTGRIADATVAGGQIRNNRSWFGRWMHWRDEYVIEGDLSKKVAVAGQPADDHFRAPLRWRKENLAGALFLAKRPFGLTLEKQ